MMSTTTAATQQIIDQRMDAIDRALLGLLPRPARQTIVAEIESRVKEWAAAG